MRERLIVAFLVLIFCCPNAGKAQVINFKKVGDKKVMCLRSGLVSTFNDCGVKTDWYTYVLLA
jgi:hypothetical protein